MRIVRIICVKKKLSKYENKESCCRLFLYFKIELIGEIDTVVKLIIFNCDYYVFLVNRFGL